MKRLVWLSTILCLVSLTFLISLTSPQSLFASTTVRFLYDGDGVRVAKIEEGKTVLYVGGIEKNVSTGEITKYYSMGNTKIALRDTNGLSYVVSDNLGSTRLLTDEEGTVKGNSKYYPYGQKRTQTGIISTRQYTGQLSDSSTGLYFYNARYYDPINATFIQPDKVGSLSNRYNYTAGNPIRFFDSSGNDPVDDLARYLCSTERPAEECATYITPQIWGGSGVRGEEGLANRSLNTGLSTYNAVKNGSVDPKYAATRMNVDAGFIDWMKNDRFLNSSDINSLLRANVSNVNIALMLAIGYQETGNLDPVYITHAHVGFNFLNMEQFYHDVIVNPNYKFDGNKTISYVPGLDNDNLIPLIYDTRIRAGYSPSGVANPGMTFSAVLSNGQINPDIFAYYSGKDNYNELWWSKVQATYNALSNFASDYPEEYGWLLDDLTQFSNPHTQSGNYLAE